MDLIKEVAGSNIDLARAKRLAKRNCRYCHGRGYLSFDGYDRYCYGPKCAAPVPSEESKRGK